MPDSSTYDTPYSYDYQPVTSGSEVATDPAMAAGVFLMLGIFTLISYVIGAVLMGLVFKKAGIPMWKAWVPVYNLWTFLEMGDQKGWISLLAAIPIVNFVTIWIAIVFIAIAAYRIGLKFGKEGWFVLIYIFFAPVWYLWLAFDDTAVWQGSVDKSAGTPPADTPVGTPPVATEFPQATTPADQPTPPRPTDNSQEPPRPPQQPTAM